MLDNFQKDVLLVNYTTFRIGGPARYFVSVKNTQELIGAIEWAKNNSSSFFTLGGGSNLLVSDKGFEGLVIKIKNEKLKIKNENEKLKIECETGVPLGRIIMETVKSGYSGAEWGFGIPGTVGGAICGNAGRLGQSISQVVESVTVLDQNLSTKTLSKSECDFGYRESRFKKTKEIILSAVLVFEKKEPAAIEAVLNEAKAVVKNSPPFPSAGCIFKNYLLKDGDILLKEHPELAGRVRGGKLSVGFLIDQCGLAGRQVGSAKIWEGHANYIVNIGGAKAKDVLELIKICKNSVREKFGIELEEEIRYLGAVQ